LPLSPILRRIRSQRAIETEGEDMNVRTKLIGTLVLAAAIAAPVAQGQRPDDREGVRGPGGIAALQTQAPSANHPDNRVEPRGPGGVDAVQVSTAIRPDDRAGLRGPGAVDSTQRPGASSHPDNRAGLRGPGATATVVVSQPSATGFDWNDALIGGIGGMGMALLLTGCFFLLMSQRNRARVA
jgi:hypothetical protein